MEGAQTSVHALEGGGGREKFYTVLGGGGGQKVLPVINDQSLTRISKLSLRIVHYDILHYRRV